MSSTSASQPSARQPSSSELQIGLTQAPRPPVAAFVLGAVLIGMIGVSIATLFLFSQSSGALASASIGIAVSLAGLGFLIFGNSQRAQLIIEFSTHAAALMNALDDDYIQGYEARSEALYDLKKLKNALLRLRASDQALEISQWRLRQVREYRSDLPNW